MPCLSLPLPNTVLNARCSKRMFAYSRSFWTVLLHLFRYSTGTCATGSAEDSWGDGPLPLLNEVREIPILPLSDTVPRTFVFQASTALTSLMLYQNSADIHWCLHRRGNGDLSLSLRDCPCPSISNHWRLHHQAATPLLDGRGQRNAALSNTAKR